MKRILKLFKLSEGKNAVEKYLFNYYDNNETKNNIYKTINSGSKGGKINLLQIVGTVGPQDIWGQRVSNGYTDRTLPHFIRMILHQMPKDLLKIHL